MKPRRDGVTDFSGGVRNIGARRDTGENESLLIDNWRLTLSHGLVRRYGSQKIHTSSFGGTVLAVYEWRFSNIGAGYLMVQAGSHIYATPSDGLLYPATFTDLGSVVSSSFNAGMAGFRDNAGEVVYIADNGQLNKWDTSTFSTDLPGTPTGITQLVVYNRRLFGFNGDTLYWSDLDNGDTLGDNTNGGGSARIKTFGGGPIVGLAVVGTTLFIFQDNGVSRFRGWSQDDIDIQSGTSAVNNPIGADDWRGITVFNGYAYWISADKKAYRLSEDGDVEEIGRQITLVFQGSPIAVANKEEREIWFRNIGSGSQVYIYNIDLNAWTTATFNQGSSAWSMFTWLKSRFTDSQGTMLAASFDGFIYDLRYTTAVLDATNADGTGGSAYVSKIITNPFEFGDASLVKALRYGYIGADNLSGSVTVTIMDDSGVLVGSSAQSVPVGGGVTRFQAWGNYKAPAVQVAYGGATLATLSDIWLYGFPYNRP